MIIKLIISAAAYLILAPFIGGFLTGIGRKLSAKMQGRKGAPVLQPFNDVKKLMNKEDSGIPVLHDIYVKLFMLFTVAAGVIFFAGNSMMITIMAMIISWGFLVIAGNTSNSSRAHFGVKTEMIRMAICIPVLFITASGLYLYCGSFHSRDIAMGSSMPVLPLIGVFAVLVIGLSAMLGGTPFGKGAGGSIVRGSKDITAAFSCRSLAVFEITEWYRLVLILGFVFLFFCNGKIWGYIIGAVLCLLVYIAVILIDSCLAKLTTRTSFRFAWAAAVVLGIVDMFILYIVL